MRSLMLFLLVFVAGCVSVQRSPSSESVAGTQGENGSTGTNGQAGGGNAKDFYDRYGECKKLSHAELSRNGIEKIISNPKCNVGSIESLLGHLPDSLYSNYTLFYKSESLQGPHEVDYMNPRAIVYGKATPFSVPKLVMTFNGSPKQPGFSSLEFMEFREESGGKKSFEFFEVTDSNSSRRLSISESNPAKCVRCHDSPAKPILRTYPFWPGSYGSMNFPKKETAALEIEKFLKFQEEAKDHPRYRFLPPVTNPSYQDIKNQIDLFGSTLLNGLVKSNASIIVASPEYKKTKYSVLSALLQCPAWPATLPTAERLRLENNLDVIFDLKKRIPDEKVKEIFSAFYHLNDYREFPNNYSTRASSFAEALDKLNFQFGPYPEYVRLQADTFSRQGLHEESSIPAGLRLLMEGRGIRIGKLFLPLDQGSYHVHEGMNDFKKAWIDALLEQDEDLAKFSSRVNQALTNFNYAGTAQKTYVVYDSNLCSDLQALSLEAMPGLKIPMFEGPRLARNSGYPEVFKKSCASCHSDGALDVPQIPFHDQKFMREWILNKENKKMLINRLNGNNGRAMPPSRFLTTTERQEIKDYLRALSAKPQ